MVCQGRGYRAFRQARDRRGARADQQAVGGDSHLELGQAAGLDGDVEPPGMAGRSASRSSSSMAMAARSIRAWRWAAVGVRWALGSPRLSRPTTSPPGVTRGAQAKKRTLTWCRPGSRALKPRVLVMSLMICHLGSRHHDVGEAAGAGMVALADAELALQEQPVLVDQHDGGARRFECPGRRGGRCGRTGRRWGRRGRSGRAAHGPAPPPLPRPRSHGSFHGLSTSPSAATFAAGRRLPARGLMVKLGRGV